MKNPIDSRTAMFIMWYTNNTISEGNNVRIYNGVRYFTDNRSSLDDLFNIFIKQVMNN